MTKKNKKVRRLRELYPEVRCKVLYQRDYLHLAVKYGLEDAPLEQPSVARLPAPTTGGQEGLFETG